MALPATGGAAAAAMAWNMAAGASAGQPQPQRQQQQQSYLALPPSTTAPSDTLAGFLHLPSVKAAGNAKPGERLLWARITHPVPGVVPPPPGAAVLAGAAEEEEHNPEGGRPRLGGRMWPCLVYFGGCVEVLKELDPKLGEFCAKQKKSAHDVHFRL